MKQAVDFAPAGPQGIAAGAGCVAMVPARRAAIAAYQIIDTPAEPAFDDIAKLAAAICGTSMAAISLVCDDRQWFKSEIGLGVRETPASVSFCAHAITAGGLLVVPDAASDHRFVDNVLVAGAPLVRFYAGMPLVTPDGVSLGALSVLDPQSRPAGLDNLQRTTLEVLANQVVAQLELRKTISQRNRHLAAQFASAEELRWLATHDTLTHLPNRALFHERLERGIL